MCIHLLYHAVQCICIILLIFLQVKASDVIRYFIATALFHMAKELPCIYHAIFSE